MVQRTGMLAAVLVVAASLGAAQVSAPHAERDHGQNDPDDCEPGVQGSAYVPVDSWVYPAVLRLYALGYVDTVFVGMRPWTRESLRHMLEDAGSRIEDDGSRPVADEAGRIYDALNRELGLDKAVPCGRQENRVRVESVYSFARGISGTPLRDSFHLGSTIVNDYGRPYEKGFNNATGVSGTLNAGRFVLYARGEFQGAPSATGYSTALAATLSNIDQILFLNPATGLPYSQPTIPLGPVAKATQGRLLEAYASMHWAGHEFSLGKQDEWLGPGVGGGMAYSNNAENIYSFRINRVEPLTIPLLSNLTGPFRYEFLVGALRGHTYVPQSGPGSFNNPEPWVNPGDPWMHLEKISFRPTRNLEFGFERTVIWGGQGHEPITLHSFLRSFFSLTNTSDAVKNSAQDPGARFGAFDFSWRLPFVSNWLTLYSDSEAHDDVSPSDAPRHACVRPGLYLSHVPGIPKLDIRIEGVSTDPPVSRSQGGTFEYWEGIQRQGYTNQGQLFGDWIGREDKGGQGWITYHLSGNEWVQVGIRNQKAAKDFIPGGTTLNDINFQAVKRIGKDFEINGNFTYERWKAPIYLPGQQTVTTTTIQLTWFPERKISF